MQDTQYQYILRKNVDWIELMIQLGPSPVGTEYKLFHQIAIIVAEAAMSLILKYKW